MCWPLSVFCRPAEPRTGDDEQRAVGRAGAATRPLGLHAAAAGCGAGGGGGGADDLQGAAGAAGGRAGPAVHASAQPAGGGQASAPLRPLPGLPGPARGLRAARRPLAARVARPAGRRKPPMTPPFVLHSVSSRCLASEQAQNLSRRICYFGFYSIKVACCANYICPTF